MIKILALVLNILSPFKSIQPTRFMAFTKPAPITVALGGHISKQATNKVNPPGCSINSSTTTKPNGSVETRETLTCTKVTVKKPSGATVRTPNLNSQQNEELKNFLLIF